VPVYGFAPYLRGYVSRRALDLSRREVNPLERDCLIKRAMGFSDETFTRAAGLLRLRRQPSCAIP